MIMELQPFGPVEQAIQKSAAPGVAKPKTIMTFLGGVLIALAAVAVGWRIASYLKMKKDKKKEKETLPPESVSRL